MSYEIIYDKQFIKLSKDNENMFVPMVLAGSSNCYDWNNRRDRSWFPFSLNQNLLITEKDAIEYWEDSKSKIISNKSDVDHVDIESSFGYYTGIAIGGNTYNTTYGNTLGIFKTGIKKSLTIEQLKSEGISVTISSGYYPKESREKYGIEPFYKLVESNDNFFEILDKYNSLFKDTPIRPTVEFGGMSETRPKNLRKKYFSKPKSEKVKKTINVFYRILINESTYFVKRSKRRLWHTRYESGAKEYLNKNIAMKTIEVLKSRGYDFTFKLETVNETKTVLV